jgi:hypothetical protein
MEKGTDALVIFYFVLWAVALQVTNKYQPFDTAAMWTCNKNAWRRFVVSIIILYVLPVSWFVFLYKCVFYYEKGLWSIVGAAVSSLSVFGFHRILHAIVASDSSYRWFYTDEEILAIRKGGTSQIILHHFGLILVLALYIYWVL